MTHFKRDSALIHYHAADINLIPRKLMGVLIWKAFDAQAGSRRFSAPVKDVMGAIRFSSRNKKPIWDALDYLMTSGIRWDVLDSRGRKLVGASTFLASYQVVDGKVLEWSFSEHLLDRVLRPEAFAYFDPEINARFQRVAGLALYETCKRFHGVGCTPWLQMEVWRKLLDAGSPTYDDTKRLVEKVVRPAVEEVAAVSDIRLTMETIRKDRRIDQIRFVIENNAQPSLDIEPEITVEQSEIFVILTNDFGVAAPVAARFVTQHSESYLRDNIAVAQAAAKKRPVGNIAGLVVAAIERDFRKKESADERRAREIKQAAEEEALRRTKSAESATLERRTHEEMAWRKVQMMSADEREHIFAAFSASHQHLFAFTKVHSTAFVEKGVVDNSPLLRAAMTAYLLTDRGAA